jgi:hypothetical protein
MLGKKFWIAVVLVMVCVFTAAGQSTVADLDTAIQQASRDINLKFAMSPRVALVSFGSTNDLSAYVLREMQVILERSRSAVFVPRQDIDNALRGMRLTPSSEVSDADARQIGRAVNASMVITGTLVQSGANYRFRTRLITVSNGTLQATTDLIIRDNSGLRRLLGIAEAAVVPVPEPERVVVPTPVPDTRVVPTPGPAAAPAEGAKVFVPRIRATEGGVPIDTWIHRAEYLGGFFLIYRTSREIGDMPTGGLVGPFSGWDHRNIILQDLDNPGNVWNPVRWSMTTLPPTNGPFWVLSFENVTGTRFRLTDPRRNPPQVFTEFSLR